MLRPTVTCLLLAALLRLQAETGCHCTRIVLDAGEPIHHAHSCCAGPNHHPGRHDGAGDAHAALHEEGHGHHHVPAPCDGCPDCVEANPEYLRAQSALELEPPVLLVSYLTAAPVRSELVASTAILRPVTDGGGGSLLLCGAHLRI